MLSKAERDALVTQHMDYARNLALDAARNVPRFVRREDVVAAGHEGLVSAAQRFDPTKGAAFVTFAYYRVRGAVFDFIRRQTSADPYHRARAAADAAADDVVQSALENRPRNANDKPADAADALAAVLDSVASVFTVAECAESLLSQEPRGADPEAEAAQREEARSLQAVIDTLPEKERAMLRAVYFEHATIEEAGQTMGLSKSWASRLHARALGLMREALGAPPGE